MPKAVIIDIATDVPAKVVSNADLESRNIGWTAEQIQAKTGIAERRVAADGECSSDLAVRAAEKLFKKGRVKPEQIDFLLFCTQSPDYFLPSTACMLQDRLGLSLNCGAFDYNLGCSGYVVGLSLAKALIESEQARCVLLLTGETYSKFIHPQDRSVCTLFGDGASATAVQADPSAPAGLDQFVFGTDGRGWRTLIVPAGGMRLPRSTQTAQESMDEDGITRSQDNLHMNGKEIFRFALQVVPKTVQRLLDVANVAKEDIDFLVLHQANRFMLDELNKRLRLPIEKVPYEFADVGNTVSATIPIVLERMVDHQRLQRGHRLLLVGFGVGYSWAGGIITWR
jgi:3-oxoacyl-[acyl-carrier-protein] synthase-3